MKDANGSRFELLLGEADWGRCTSASGDGLVRPLADIWSDADAAEALVYDRELQSLTLAPRVARFRAVATDTPPDPLQRLGAAADAFGNVYWVADGGARIAVLGGGSRAATPHSLAQQAPAPAASGDFAPVAEPARAGKVLLRALAVTSQHYLVAGVRPEGARTGGLRVFDLLAGGPALPLRWPADWPFDPHDMAPRPCGGLAVLDRTNARVWLLDRRLGMQAVFAVAADDPGRPDDFLPEDGADAGATIPPRQPWFELAHDGAGGTDPVSIDVLADGAILVVDAAGSDGFALVSLYVDGVLAGRASSRCVLDVLDADERAGFVLRAHDAALCPLVQDQPERLVIASSEGNQCFAFDLVRTGSALALQPVRSLLPMRRFAGKGLVRRQPVNAQRLPEDTGLMYDALGVWLPLVREKRPRYAGHGELQTWALDSGEPACTWNRVIIDGCIPSGSRVRLASRAADESAQLADQPWRDEPQPMLRPDGSELPWLLEGPGTRTDAASGRGCWELLLQHAHGRYLQLRLVIESADELATPRLHALRAWSPRFSYSRRYLPAVYREDEASADFLERFLANFEGLFTALEDRIAAASALFDVRTAPPATLDWLASWLGLVMDPAVEAERKRLLIRFAVPLFQYRGTTQGLRLATELVLSSCMRPEDFQLPARSQQQPYGIRVVERFLTRRLPRALLGETLVDVPRRLAETALWSAAEGREGLDRRWRAALAAAGQTGAESAQYTPVEPQDHAASWRTFSATQLGIVPQLAGALRARWSSWLSAFKPEERQGFTDQRLPVDWPASEAARKLWRDFLAALPADLRRWLARWQGFLARRYRSLAAHGKVWGTSWPEFALVPAPDVLPAGADALADWALFETRLEVMERAAHRFTVLVPSSGPLAEEQALARHMEWAQRVVRLEKPAHTVFDVRPYWAMFRTGYARLGLDTVLGEGSRAPSLAPQLIVGHGHVGASRVALAPHVPQDRLLLAC